jgi:hypothetical protein
MLVAAVVLLAGAASYAHHSYASTYDVRQEVTLKGKLVQFVYRNPHTFVHVQAPDENGQMQRWAVEWGGTTQLDRSGVTRDTLKVGDDVVIVARPSRVQGEYRALMVKLTRPSDGFTWGTRTGEAVD